MNSATDLRYGHFWNQAQYTRALDKPTFETYYMASRPKCGKIKTPTFAGVIQDADIISAEVIK